MAEISIAKQYAKLQEIEATAKQWWDKKDRETAKLARIAKLGRKKSIVVPISENRGIRITNNFKTKESKIFAPAFARKWDLKEVPLDNS
jgi:hypothetical protein